MENHFTEILFTLSDAKINFVVGGGVAVVLHGVERVTMDIDIALEFTQPNLEKFIRVAKNMNLTPRVPVPIEFLLDPKSIEKMIVEKNALVFSLIDNHNPLKHIDVFLKPENSYENLHKSSVKVNISGREILIASKEKLIEMKKRVTPSRSKDLHDIAELEKLLK